MSIKINVQFEVRSLLIMKNTLKQMGIDYTELDDHRLNIDYKYHKTIIDSETGMISYDQENKKQIDDITQEYMVNFYKDKAIREGNRFKEIRNANGEVELHIVRR